MIESRTRKSNFIKLFDKTPATVQCPHFYELVLSNGCPYDCAYCYLKLTFRGKTKPVVFNNAWQEIQKELEKIDRGVFSTGELADSLAIIPPTLQECIDYFTNVKNKTLLLVTKSTNIDLLKSQTPHDNIIVSFSLNSVPAYEMLEKKVPHPAQRLKAADELIQLGWRVRIRLDPVVLSENLDFRHYESICKKIKAINPEMVTVGTLRQYPTLRNFARNAPNEGLTKAPDGRMRYSIDQRKQVYQYIASWLGFQPALCKESHELWNLIGWEFTGCNCTDNK